jgi:pimeloyl-ACP methyl ester carboxylesterase
MAEAGDASRLLSFGGVGDPTLPSSRTVSDLSNRSGLSGTGYARVVDMETLQLGGGGSLEFCRSGPEDAEVLLVFHVGSPSAAAVFPNVTEVAAARGVRTVTYSRPGYGGSTRRKGRTFADEAANTAALADHVGASTFLVAGWSGGGPAALACAALLPERVRSCAVLAGASPREDVGEEWFDWWNDEDREELRALATSPPDPFVPEYEEGAKMFAAITATELVNFPGSPEADREALTRSPGFAEALADSMRRAVGTGIDGWLDDTVAHARPWGFRVRDIGVPVTIRQGELDHLMRIEHGRWLAKHIPGARAQILAEHGHGSIVEPFDDVMDALLQGS